MRTKMFGQGFVPEVTMEGDEKQRPVTHRGDSVRLQEPANNDERDKENLLTPARPLRPSHTDVNNVSAESSREMFRAADIFSPTLSGPQKSSGTFAPVSPARMTSTPNSTAVLRYFPSPKLDCDAVSFSEQSSGSENVSQCISSIINTLPSFPLSPSSSSPLRNGGVLANTAPSDILKGVRAYVEVRCGKEDISAGLVALLERLGATVLKHMSHTVTHIVFRHGRKSTRRKAIHWNIPMVSPLWVDNCRLQKKKVPEEDYPAKIPATLDECLIPNKKIPKWCKIPKETKPGTKRANRTSTARKTRSKTNPQPPATPPALVHPGTGADLGHEAPLPLVPGNVSHQPQDIPVSGPKSPKTPRVRRSLRTVLLKLRAETLKKNVAKYSTLAEELPVEQSFVECSSDLKESPRAELNVPEQVQKPVRRRQLFSQKAAEDGPPSLIIARTPPSEKCVSSFFDDEELIPLRKRLEAEKSSQNDGAGTGEIPKINYYTYLASTDEKPTDVPEALTGDTVLQTEATASRSSRKRKHKQRNSGERLPKKKKLLDNEVGKTDCKAAPQSLDPNSSKRHSSLEDFKMDVHRKHNMKMCSWLNSSTDDCKQNVPSLVLTSVKTSEEEAIQGVLQALGCFRVEDEVTQSTTHVVCGEKKRTLNMLLAMAQGCWILSPQWVYKSLESGKWLQEEPYEVAEYFPAVKLSRLQRGLSVKLCLFSDVGFIYVSSSSSPPCNKLRLLVQWAGGKVAQSYLRCDVAVGPVPPAKKFGAVVHVSEKWILDSISEHQTLPLEDYYT